MSDSPLTLAERVKAAAKPDRELDALIRCALFAPPGAYVEQSAINGAWVVYSGAESRSGRPRLFEHWPSQEARNGAFTASIDSALTLVPFGCHPVTLEIHSDGTCEAECWTFSEDGADNHIQVAAYSPALALCAAALRARATLPPSALEKEDAPNG